MAHIGSVCNTEFYEDIGRGRRRNLGFVYFNEGFGIGKFNEYRYLGTANPPARTENSVRIACIGDSYIEAFQIFERDHFGKVAEEKLLSEFPAMSFEFLNFGRSGFDIGDFYAYQKLFVDTFEPDYILYFISNSDLIPKYTDPLCPRTVIENDSLIISFDFDKSALRNYMYMKYIMQKSSIVNMINGCRRKSSLVPPLSIFLGKVYDWLHSGSKDSQNSSAIKEDYTINKITLEIIQSLDPGKVIFVNKSMDSIDENVEEIIIRGGFRYIDLSIPLNYSKNLGILPNNWEVTGKVGHWNRYGHQLIGQNLANEIRKTIIKSDLLNKYSYQ
jgi:hypothetical protein